jgi:hypothetical protein
MAIEFPESASGRKGSKLDKLRERIRRRAHIPKTKNIPGETSNVPRNVKPPRGKVLSGLRGTGGALLAAGDIDLVTKLGSDVALKTDELRKASGLSESKIPLVNALQRGLGAVRTVAEPFVPSRFLERFGSSAGLSLDRLIHGTPGGGAVRGRISKASDLQPLLDPVRKATSGLREFATGKGGFDPNDPLFDASPEELIPRRSQVTDVTPEAEDAVQKGLRIAFPEERRSIIAPDSARIADAQDELEVPTSGLGAVNQEALSPENIAEVRAFHAGGVPQVDLGQRLADLEGATRAFQDLNETQKAASLGLSVPQYRSFQERKTRDAVIANAKLSVSSSDPAGQALAVEQALRDFDTQKDREAVRDVEGLRAGTDIGIASADRSLKAAIAESKYMIESEKLGISQQEANTNLKKARNEALIEAAKIEADLSETQREKLKEDIEFVMDEDPRVRQAHLDRIRSDVSRSGIVHAQLMEQIMTNLELAKDKPSLLESLFRTGDEPLTVGLGEELQKSRGLFGGLRAGTEGRGIDIESLGRRNPVLADVIREGLRR